MPGAFLSHRMTLTHANACFTADSESDLTQPLNQILRRQMRITAQGYISSLEEANKALAECVDGVLEQTSDMAKINEEIARTTEAMAKIAKGLEPH